MASGIDAITSPTLSETGTTNSAKDYKNISLIGHPSNNAEGNSESLQDQELNIEEQADVNHLRHQWDLLYNCIGP